jgi:TolB-like protein
VVALAARIRNGEVAAPAAPRLHVAPATAAEPRPAVAPAPAAPAIAAAAPAAPVPVDPGTIAVLPFEHLGDAAHAAFTEGVSEEVLHALAEVPGLAVVARSASFAFRGAGLELVDVATRLGAGLIVEGSVRHCGACVRVTARLVDVATRRPLAAERVDAVRADAGAGSSFALQDEIAARVVARVVGAVPGLAAVAGAA